jgi:hypothetical protein
MSGGANGPMLEATGLWATTSVKRGQYLIGRPGRVRVLVMENRTWQSDDEPNYHLFFVEAPNRRQPGQERVGPRAARTGQSPCQWPTGAIPGAAQPPASALGALIHPS